MMKVTILLSVAFLSSACWAAEALTPGKVEADITTEGLKKNLQELSQISQANGGNRAFGLPGYKASSDFVLERVENKFGNQFDSWIQYFNHTFEQTRKISITGPDGETVPVVKLLYNSPTPLPDGITAPLIDTPVDDDKGSACFEDQWENIDATDKLVLIKRGACAVSDKLKLAKAHGALGAVLWNQSPGTPGGATLGAENIALLVPVGLVNMDVGEAWKTRLAAGEELTVKLLVDSVFEKRESWNIIAESKEGDPNNIVMLGAHLDSVQTGPGINDNGSGTSALLEIMTSFSQYKGFTNKIRFAWWGAEEVGLVGSRFYTSNLTEEADKIRFYFNYDMIGSPNPIYAVLKSDNEGDMAGVQPLYDYLLAAGKPAKFSDFGVGSDHIGFLHLGIPASSIFTGAGEPMDSCYHQPCDNASNVNWDAFTINAKAAGVIAAQMALSLEGVPPRNKTAVKMGDSCYSSCSMRHIAYCT